MSPFRHPKISLRVLMTHTDALLNKISCGIFNVVLGHMAAFFTACVRRSNVSLSCHERIEALDLMWCPAGAKAPQHFDGTRLIMENTRIKL